MRRRIKDTQPTPVRRRGPRWFAMMAIALACAIGAAVLIGRAAEQSAAEQLLVLTQSVGLLAVMVAAIGLTLESGWALLALTLSWAGVHATAVFVIAPILGVGLGGETALTLASSVGIVFIASAVLWRRRHA